MNKEGKKALLLAMLTVLGVLSGCKKNDNHVNQTSTVTYVAPKTQTPGLYDTAFEEMHEIAALAAGSTVYDSGMRVVRTLSEEESVWVQFVNQDYAIIDDKTGERYVVRKEDLTILPSISVNYYAFILNDAPVYTEPMTYNFNKTEEIIEENQMVLVKREFDQKLYVLDEFGNGKIIRKMDVQKLPDLYIEIDISDQRIRLYQGNEVVLQGSVVTGQANSTPTCEGYFKVNGNKARKKTLKDGAFVEYWMPFIDDLFGIHDASWRWGNFGGNIYLTNGSHGCVNTSNDIAEELYNNTGVGTPVLIHK